MATKLAHKPRAIKPVSSAKINKLGSVYDEMTFAAFAGLNNKYANTEVADNECTDLLNVEFDDVGAPVQRKGYTLANNFGASQINSILRFYTASARKMIVSYGTSLIAYDPVANTTASLSTTLHGSGKRFSDAIDTVHNVAYLANGDTTDKLMSWDGTTFKTQVGTTATTWVASTAYNINDKASNGGNVYICTVAGTSAASGGPTGTGSSITDGTVTWNYYAASGYGPSCQYLVYHKNHLYASGDPGFPNRLYMSDQGDPTSWPSLNFIDFDDGVGGITGMAQLGDTLVVFKDVGVFLMTGSDPSNYAVVDTFAGQRGAVSQWSIVQIPNGLVFLARDGVWLFDGKKFTLLSYKIQTSVDSWNQAQLQNAVAFEYDHKYWLSVPEGTGQTANNYTYVYAYQFGWWTKHSIAMQSANSVQNSNMQILPYFSDTAGNVFQADTGIQDNGTAISSYLLTKNYDFGTVSHVKSYKQVFVEALAQVGSYVLNLTFSLDFDKNQATLQMPLGYKNPTVWGQFNWGQSNWGGQGNVIHSSTNLPGQSTYLQFKLQSTGPFTFHGWTVRYKIKKMMTR